jgi:hypothetical protein
MKKLALIVVILSMILSGCTGLVVQVNIDGRKQEERVPDITVEEPQVLQEETTHIEQEAI